jgi:hypothetical protein
MKIFFTVVCMLLSFSSFAQDSQSNAAEPGRQSFYAELGGPAFYFLPILIPDSTKAERV